MSGGPTMTQTASAAPPPARGTSGQSGWQRAMERHKVELCIFAILVALYASFLIGNFQTFSQFGIYRAFMESMPLFGIMALSATFIVTLGEIDLSFPSIMALSSYSFGMVFQALLPSAGPNVAFLAGLAVAVAIGVGTGFFNGVLVTRVGIPSIVATIGTMFLWRGLTNVLAQGHGIALVALRDSVFHPILVGNLAGLLPAQFLWFVALGVLAHLIYRRHTFGSHVLFVGDNAGSARMMGINVERVKITCFVQLGVFAALAGIFSAALVTYVYPSTGDAILLPTLAAIFIGGTSVFGGRGTMIGTFIGVVIIGSLETGIVSGLGVQAFWTEVIYGVLITVSVSLYAVLMRRSQ